MKKPTQLQSRPDLLNFSFSGCGFMCVYHAGVAAAVREYAPQLLQNKILGASAGSIVACGLITGVCISHATSTILKVVSQARARTLGPLHPEFDLLGVVRVELSKTLPPDAYKTCSGRLIISLTRWEDYVNVRVDEYRSNDDLIDAIMCSCFIPIYCGMRPPTFRGVQYIDGGVSDNQPRYDENTVTVSPFSGESDICPPDYESASIYGVDFNGTSIRLTQGNMFRLMMCLWPRSNEDLSQMCLQGFSDATRFLYKRGLAPCISCLTIQTEVEGECVSDVEEKTPRMLSPTNGLLRKRSSSAALRYRNESECDTCCSDHMYNMRLTNLTLPSVIKKPFEEAAALEGRVMSYLMSFRFVRLARTAFGISKLPLDVLVVFARNISSYISLAGPPTWFAKKMQMLAEFILSEVDKQKTRYTRFSYHVALTEMDGPSGFAEERETQIELSDEAKRELDLIRERDRRNRSRKSTVEKPPQIVQPAAVAMAAPSSSFDTNFDDIDSYQHVVEFSKSHDAMYEFHYLDDNNRMRSFELFNVRRQPHDCRSSTASSSRVVNVVPEEDETEATEFVELSSEAPNVSQPVMTSSPETSSGANVATADGDDSGVSGVEGHGSSSASKRDACCSPVRHLDTSYNTIPPRTPPGSRIKTTSRRHTMANPPPSARKQSIAAVLASREMSSDSEVDGSEKLFVPSRRAWRAEQPHDSSAATRSASPDSSPTLHN